MISPVMVPPLMPWAKPFTVLPRMTTFVMPSQFRTTPPEYCPVTGVMIPDPTPVKLLSTTVRPSVAVLTNTPAPAMPDTVLPRTVTPVAPVARANAHAAYTDVVFTQSVPLPTTVRPVTVLPVLRIMLVCSAVVCVMVAFDPSR